MSFNIIEACKNISKQYKRYLKTTFAIKDPDYAKIYNEKIDSECSFDKGPYLEVSGSFEKGKSIKELIEEGVLSTDFKKIKRLYDIKNLYKHQEEAIRKAQTGSNLIVTTGTGSGKTECFLIPIINELMREKERGTLSDGVRAMIIYPMNALANDQIDRLRKLFLNYPEITFGCYTGQTPDFYNRAAKDKKSGLEQYKELNGNRQDIPELQKPLPNERICRDDMKRNPPHILITNYAMLEYLMLRPEDNVFFSGDCAKNWRFIVLDEAHTYTNSNGIEVSMLIKRLIAAINKPDNKPALQFILTSATLGDKKANNQIIEFAHNLCAVPFSEESIIRAKRVEIIKGETSKLLDKEFFLFVNDLMEKGYSDDDTLAKIKEKYKFNVESNGKLNGYLYDLLLQDETFWNIKNHLVSPKSVSELKRIIGYSDLEITAFVDVCSKAEKNDSKLFDARYHMFLRAPEGVFVTLGSHKDLFFERKDHIDVDKQQYKVFEIATCKQCHSMYLLGYINKTTNQFSQKSNADGTEIKEAFYIGDTLNDSDEDNLLEKEQLDVTKYLLCPHCGRIFKKDLVKPHRCGHPEEEYITLIQVKTKNESTSRVTKCINCEYTNRLGVLRGFFAGQEAATSVIGTSLFENLPSHISNITIHHKEDEDDFFGDGEDYETVETVKTAKQFIAFSDNRQAAAYYASYLTISYNDILNSRLAISCLNNSKKESLSFDQMVAAISSEMSKNDIRDANEYLNNFGNTDYDKEAEKALLSLLLDNHSMNSVFGLGLMAVDFDTDLHFLASNPKIKLSAEDIKNICMVITLGLLYDSCVFISLSQADIEEITHAGHLTDIVKNNSSKTSKSFLPKTDSNTNRRLDYIIRVLENCTTLTSFNKPIKETAKAFLNGLWDHFFTGSTSRASSSILTQNKTNNNYSVNPKILTFRKNVQWYRCTKCKKLTPYNVHGVCPTFHCDGTLEPVDIDTLQCQNHYYRMYKDLPIEPLRIVEHTAQLNKEEAYKYQNLFREKKLNALSCSTTFEMGVDVGSLETVFMRNVPPSPSNYAQRAGRAGRSKESAAFALTFCNRSNHDFAFFNKPVAMISGQIIPPHFKTDNKKIGIRHVYSSAFSFFFKRYPDYFVDVENFIENNKTTNLKGYDVLYDYLTNDSESRNELRNYLRSSVPVTLQSEYGIENFKWVDMLFAESPSDDYPSLFLVKSRYETEIHELEKACRNTKDPFINRQIETRIKNYRQEPIISFLSRNNILPKYGFPVDTVELEPNAKTNSKNKDTSGLTLSRDMSMAVAEYAPGCEVVANNQVYTSRYIKMDPRRGWRMYDFYRCKKCNTLSIKVHSSDTPKEEENTTNNIETSSEQATNSNEISTKCTCSFCGEEFSSNKYKTFIIPEFGFIADPTTHKPTLIKPEKTYRTEATFCKYPDSDHDSKPTKCTFGNTIIELTTVSNDGDMVILNTANFYVCPKCGYAIEAEKGQLYKKLPNQKHRDSKGYLCKEETLLSYSLGYRFKTDILRISISKPLLETAEYIHDEAYSILQALILASCKELGIDSTEIQGCLQYNASGNFDYILYDRTPGGAGHVKKINNQTIMYHILQNACNLTENCPSCDPDSSCYSCLRTYQNQKHHDIMKRRYVYEYLKTILQDYDPEESDSMLETDFIQYLVTMSDQYHVTGKEKNIYQFLFNGNEWTMEPQFYLDPLSGVVKPSKPDFVLTPKDTTEHKKIAIFTDGYSFHNSKVDEDTVKRDAIRATDNFRVFSFSWNDVHNHAQGNNPAIRIFEDKTLLSHINITEKKPTSENSLDLLLDYLRMPDSESVFKHRAMAYLNAMVSLSAKDSGEENLSEFFKKQYPSTSPICYEPDYLQNLRIYFMTSNNQQIILPYLQDIMQYITITYRKEWNTLLQFCNVMQFAGSLVSVSESGLQNQNYECLNNAVVTHDDYSDAWQDIIKLMTSIASPTEAITFATECAKRNYPIPENGIENDNGYVAELVWVEAKIAYLTKEQILSGSKEEFEKDGYTIIQSLDDLKNYFEG